MSDSAGGRESPAARLAERWRRIVVLGLLGLLLGFAWGIADQPRYAADASVIVEPPVRGDPDPVAPERFAALGSSNEVATVAAGILGGDVAGADLLSEVELSAGAGDASILVEATSELPDFAAAAADGFAEALVSVAADRANASYRRATERLEGKLAGLAPDSPEAAALSERLADLDSARATEPLTLGAAAELPDGPSENRSASASAAIGLALGLLVGLLAALFAGRSLEAGRPEVAEKLTPQRSISLPPEGEGSLADAIGVPWLGAIPDPQASIERLGPGHVALTALAAGRLERITEAIGLDGADRPRTLAVIGIDEGGSPSAAAAAALAIAAAGLDLRVLVVDACLADPSLGDLLGVEVNPGLSDYLAGSSRPREVLRRLRAEIRGGEERSLVCVPAGSEAGSGEGLGSARFDALVRRLPRVYDVVILAGPSILRGDDPRALIDLADATILVAADDPRDGALVERIAGVLHEGRPAGLLTIG